MSTDERQCEVYTKLDEILQTLLPWSEETRAFLDSCVEDYPKKTLEVSKMRDLVDKVEEGTKAILEDIATLKEKNC